MRKLVGNGGLVDAPRLLMDEARAALDRFPAPSPLHGLTHDVQWNGVCRGTETDPRETGWCVTCGRDVYDGEGSHRKTAEINQP